MPRAPSLRVAPDELAAALDGLDGEVRHGLEVAISNVAEVANAGVGEDREVLLAQGHRVLLREVAVRRAAVYVPGGAAPYPSTVVMGVVTARSAGVEEVVVCTPPPVAPVLLATCALCGIDVVYRMGGAQAVAALAYGTETVGAVDVIVGPGNLYVQEAKRLVSGQVGIDGFAGPSDLLVIFDAGDLGSLRLIALDLLAQAEHGAQSLVLAVSDDPSLLDALADELTAPGRAAAAAGLGAVRAGRGRLARRGPGVLGRLRPRAPRAGRAGRRGAGLAGALRRGRVRRLAGGDGVRRLRRRLEPRPADRRVGALRLVALAPALPPADGRDPDPGRCGWPRSPQAGRADRAGRGLPGPRRVDARAGARAAGELSDGPYRARSRARRKETDVKLEPDARRDGRG